MSEEVQETVETDETEEIDESQDDTLSLEDWKQIALKARTEAKNRRLSNKETQAKLKEYEDYKKSQLSEVERVKTEKAEVEELLKKYQKVEWRSKAAEKAKLDAAYADLIAGDSEEAMVEHAKQLAARLKNDDVRDVLSPGARGPHVEAPESEINKWFKSMWNQ